MKTTKQVILERIKRFGTASDAEPSQPRGHVDGAHASYDQASHGQLAG